MKKFGFIIFATALIVGLVVTNLFSFGRVTDKFFNFSFNFKGVRGSGNMATEKRDLSDFHSVDVSGVFQVEIAAQTEFSVEVEADDNLLPLIETKIRNGVLHIETTRKVKTENPLRIRISAPNIEKIESSGATTVSLTGLSNEGLEVDSSGASKVKISGETARLNIDVSGATKVDAEGLTAENATVEASGASHVNVNVTGNLRTDASGASKITYTGSPKDVVKKASGASSVSPR
jgi:HSP20 family molecular chaperone IbpA